MSKNDRRKEREEARRELRRFEDELPNLLRVVTPEAATLAWLMLGDKMWASEPQTEGKR